MDQSAPHTLEALDRAFDEVWHTIAVNYNAATATGGRTSLAIVILQLAGAGERSIYEIKVAAKETMTLRRLTARAGHT